ncbi:hypothetical protein, partial [Kitasatospora sp. NPDC059571]|uniref:hypothetical protein n=1 Tax=Kitasatospora sp. NPDC059571 TaxID=3346871 RepID=UPI0036BA7FCC
MQGEQWQDWVWRWASAARLTGEGRVGNLLADLAEDAPRARTAVLLSLPVAATAAALGLPAGQVPAALERLHSAGLLSYVLGGALPDHHHPEINQHPA